MKALMLRLEKGQAGILALACSWLTPLSLRKREKVTHTHYTHNSHTRSLLSPCIECSL